MSTSHPAEFPSDNPELWTLRAPTLTVAPLQAAPLAGTVTATGTATASETETDAVAAAEAATDLDDIEVYVEVVDFDDADFADAEDGSIAPPPPDSISDSVSDSVSDSDSDSVSVSAQAQPDLFRLYVDTLVQVALAAGAPAKLVEALPGMLGAARLDTQSIDAAAQDALVAAGMLARSESGALVRAEPFVGVAQAWKATLLGDEADFSLCTTMLDEWSAWIIATLAGTPQREDSLRRELRSRGVAAFGLNVEAA